MELSEFNGPYFLDQEPEPCGHYHPDVLLFQDSLNGGDKIIRTTFCFKCKSYFYKGIPVDKFSESFLKELTDEGKKVYATLEQLAAFREEKLKSFLPGNDW